ncbi:MAG: hypothetical protein J6T98_10975 [Salinivirgaceae bacterium]|nr:hypothetical protein [Salinivirgaceae bacterium]
MDTSSILIGIAVVLACALPFLLSSISRKQREKKLVDSLNQMAQSESTTICSSEICGNNAIGIDGSGRWLFYARCADGVKEKIDLESTRSCGIIDKPDTAGLIFVADGKPDIYCELFNSKVEATPYDESRMAARWHKIVVDRLAAIKS